MPVNQAPTRDIGRLSDHFGVGGGIDASYVDVVETSADLEWPLSVTTYSRMRRDPQLAAILSALTLPIRRASWSVDPAGVRDEVAQLVADDLGLPILGTEDEPGAARRRGVRWEDHIRKALLSLVFGHMGFEQRYDILDGRARLAALSERLPNTIRQILLDKQGDLLGIRQDITGHNTIPIGSLVWYTHDREGAAWQGQSVLRPGFGPWLLKHEMWRVHGTSIRRFGMGVPSVEAPAGATPGQIEEAARLAQAARVGETSGAGMPPGFKFNLTGLTGSVPDALAFIRYLDEQMAGMVLAGFLNLGSTPNGSRALGDSFIDLFKLATKAVADEHADTATGLSVQMVDYNFGEDEPAPRICVNDVGSRQEVTAASLQTLLDAGALSADPELEAYVRKEWSLPERSTPAGSYVDDQPPAPMPPPQLEVAAAAGRVYHFKHGWIPLDHADAADAGGHSLEDKPPEPVTMKFMRNPESLAKNQARGHDFAQDIEPAGRYLTEAPEGSNVPAGWQSGTVHFEHPLNIKFGGGYSDDTNWKRRLSEHYGGKTGKALAKALRADGYDAIVTYDKYGTAEIVDLRAA